MKGFKGKVAVITGGASGIGYAMAERFAAEGMKLAIADIHQPSLDEAAAKLRASGATVLAQRVDVADAAAVEAFADRVFAEYGTVHVLCNNAGVAIQQLPVWDHPLENWQWIMGINLWGVIHGIRSFVPRMLASGAEGHVVNTASMAGLITGSMGDSPYGVTKHAVVALSESLYRDLKTSGAAVGASVLCPGWTGTGIIANSDRDAPHPSGAAGSVADLPGVPDVYAPSYVAGQVFDAIRDDRFYILATQDDFLGWMKMRHDRIEDGRNPAVPRRTQ